MLVGYMFADEYIGQISGSSNDLLMNFYLKEISTLILKRRSFIGCGVFVSPYANNEVFKSVSVLNYI